MLTSFFQMIHNAIELNTFSYIMLLHMMIRGLIVYVVGLSLARFNKKLMGIRTPFNFILFIMLGSIFAAAIIDSRLFIPIIGTVIFLTVLNGVMTGLSFYYPSIESFVKGAPSVLVKDGKIQWRAMRRNFITEHELLNELHTQLHVRDLKQVEAAILASDGTINFISKPC